MLIIHHFLTSARHIRGRKGFICTDSLVSFTFAGEGRIDGEEESADAEAPDFAEESFGFRAVGVDVELEEGRVGQWDGGDDFSNGVGGVTGDLG